MRKRWSTFTNMQQCVESWDFSFKMLFGFEPSYSQHLCIFWVTGYLSSCIRPKRLTFCPDINYYTANLSHHNVCRTNYTVTDYVVKGIRRTQRVWQSLCAKEHECSDDNMKSRAAENRKSSVREGGGWGDRCSEFRPNMNVNSVNFQLPTSSGYGYFHVPEARQQTEEDKEMMMSQMWRNHLNLTWTLV